jgi:hypothetical protein
MEKQSGKIRKKKKDFTQVSNIALRDPNLSLKAKGLYGIINSFLDIPDFTLYKTYLETFCKEGRRAFQSSWDELKEHEYLIQYKLKDEKGCWVYEYELVDNPHTRFADVDNADLDNPDVENVGAINNTNTNNTKPNNTKENNTYSSSSSINTTNTPREEISDTPVPLEEDDEKELNSITSSLFKKSYGKRLSSIPGQYGCDGNMIYPALKLALENGALDLIPYVKSIFKEWKGQGIKHLSDLGIEGITTKERENEIIALYLDQLSSDNENPQKYDPELPDFMLKITDGQYYRDRSSEVKALSKLYSFNELVDRFRRTVIANQPINEAVKYLVNDYS